MAPDASILATQLVVDFARIVHDLGGNHRERAMGSNALFSNVVELFAVVGLGVADGVAVAGDGAFPIVDGGTMDAGAAGGVDFGCAFGDGREDGFLLVGECRNLLGCSHG